jgi:hypothetical protein
MGVSRKVIAASALGLTGYVLARLLLRRIKYGPGESIWGRGGKYRGDADAPDAPEEEAAPASDTTGPGDVDTEDGGGAAEYVDGRRVINVVYMPATSRPDSQSDASLASAYAPGGTTTVTALLRLTPTERLVATPDYVRAQLLARYPALPGLGAPADVEVRPVDDGYRLRLTAPATGPAPTRRDVEAAFPALFPHLEALAVR